MATAYEASSYKEDALLNPVNPSIRTFRHTNTVAYIINDTIKMFKLSKNIKIGDLLLFSEDIDSGATLTMTVRITDGTTTKNFIVANTVGQAGGVARPALLTEIDGLGFVTDTDAFWLEILIVAAPTGDGIGTLGVTAHYTAVLDNGA